MRIQRNPGLAWRKVAGETIVIHLGRKEMYSLNAAGGRIWEAIGEERSLEELEGALLTEAGAEEPARRAVHGFLAELAAEDLIRTDGPLEAPSTAPEAHGPLPAILWHEELSRFAGACAKFPGVSQICDQNPNTS
jgi:hypothetical protein